MYEDPEGNRRSKYKGSERERNDKIREDVIEGMNEKLSKCGHQIVKNGIKLCLNPYTGGTWECYNVGKEETCGWRW